MPWGLWNLLVVVSRGTALKVWSCWWAMPAALGGQPCPPKDLCSLLPVALQAACGGRNITRQWIIQAEERCCGGEERGKEDKKKRTVVCVCIYI